MLGVFALAFAQTDHKSVPVAPDQPSKPAAAQAAAGQAVTPPKPIQVQVNEVIVPVTVTDDKGRFVSDLDLKDFKILDEGHEQ